MYNSTKRSRYLHCPPLQHRHPNNTAKKKKNKQTNKTQFKSESVGRLG